MPTELEREAYDLFAEYIDEQALVNSLTPKLIEQMTGVMTGATRAEIVAAAEKEAARLVTGIVEATRKAMAETIAFGLENQLGIDGIRDVLKDTIGLDSGRSSTLNNEYLELVESGDYSADEIAAIMEKRADELKKDRANTIAQTEGKRAVEAGERANAENRGATHKYSLSAGDDRVSDACAANEARGVIPMDEEYETVDGGGADAPPYHPNCRCTVAYVTQDDLGTLEAAQDAAKEQAEKTAAARAADDAA